MSKASRNKEIQEAKKQRQLEKKQKERKKRIIETTVALSVVGAICLATGGVFLANKLHEDYLDSGKGLREVVALSTENYTVDNAMLTYFVYNDYYYYVNTYGENASYYGIDESLELSEQMYNESTGESWLDYCTEEAVDNLSSMLVLCEAAKKDNVTLSDAENEEIAKLLETVTPESYGRGVNVDDIKKSLEISYLASKYQKATQDGINITDDEIEKYYTENARDHQSAKYISWELDYLDPDLEATVAGPTEEQAEGFAQRIKAAKTADEFKSVITDCLKEMYPDITEEEIKEELDDITEASLAGTATTDLANWAFDSARVNGDTMSTIDEDENCYIIYMLTSAPQRSEENVINVRHILFNFENYETEAEALDAAEAVLKEYEDGAKTEESFAALSTQYNEDPGSQSTGGLYEGVYQGQMVTAFNDWCFDEARKTGDVDIVETEYGYHIMYFVSEGEARYKADIRTTLTNERYNAMFEEMQSAHALTVNNDAISAITGKEFSAETSSAA